LRPNRLRRDALLLLAVAATFLAYQLWLSAKLWERSGNVPPGFDDSYLYVFAVRKVVDHAALLPQTPYPPRYAHLAYLSYNGLLASASALTGWTAEQVYRGSFFAGKLVLLLCLLRLLVALERDLLVAAGMLAALAAYSGALGAHGFYWVVPTFWMTCVFFYWAAEVMERRDRSALLLAATGLLGATLHPLAPYLLVVLAGQALLLIALRRFGAPPPSFSALLLVSAGVGSGLVLPDVLALHPGYRGTLDVPPDAFMQLGGGWPEARPAAAGAMLPRLLPGLAGVHSTYVKVFASPIPLAALAGSLALLVWMRRWRLLTLFAAAAGVTLAATVHPLAYRLVLVWWPVTLMVLGAAPVLAWRGLEPRLGSRALRYATAALLSAPLVGLALAWHLFNHRIVIPQIATFAATRWDEGCARRLLAEVPPREPVFYGSKYVTSAFLAHGLERRAALPLAALPEEIRRHPARRWWAVVENPTALAATRSPDRRPDIEGAARQNGLAATTTDCGAFLLYELSGP
jgi:hypothetical protein